MTQRWLCSLVAASAAVSRREPTPLRTLLRAVRHGGRRFRDLIVGGRTALLSSAFARVAASRPGSP
ncbi:hypothetical protein ACFHYQ_29250 [Sphaerimonospora cavernae]|uniref:Uncharacterized protein n=1 Tax=Sphaerimonospora cavernae TaxID=1740611 RepID=A0ABV6UE01_9ACTN